MAEGVDYGQRYQVRPQVLASLNGQARYQEQAVNRLPPPNGWTNGTDQPDRGTILKELCQLQASNWVEPLPTAQMAYNTSPTETTKVTPFFANYGYEMEQLEGPNSNVPRASAKAQKLHMLHENLKHELEFVRQKKSPYYNLKRLEGPRFKEREKVLLSTRNLRTKEPSKKLDDRRAGPFKIKKKSLDVVFQLDIPDAMKLRS